MPKVFTADGVKKRKLYIVKDFLALGTMTNIVSQAGVGKTYLALQLAVDVALGTSFLGMDTSQMKVLLIDQDQSSDETEIRLKKFMDYYSVITHENLSISCDEYLQLKDGTLLNTIINSDANLVIIDSLTAVCNGLDMNNSTHMQKLKELYEMCINDERSIVWLHHMSEHREFTYGDAMTCNPGSLALYSSVINGTMDGYYILYNPYKGKHLKELIIRPIVKRFPIKTGIFKTGLVEDGDTFHFRPYEQLDVKEDELATHDELVMLNMFAESADSKPFYYVKEVADMSKDWKAINTVRTILNSLCNKQLLELQAVSHNKFSYSITKRGIEMVKNEYNRMEEVVISGDPVIDL